MRLQSLQDVFVNQLEDLYSAETQLAEALPKVAAAANDEQLRQALQQHSTETNEHVSRLGEIFSNPRDRQPARPSVRSYGWVA